MLTDVTPAPFNADEPRVLLPLRKTTVPVGTPPLPLTVALNVTEFPAGAGFCDELIVVVLELTAGTALVMIWDSTVEVLPAKVLLPP